MAKWNLNTKKRVAALLEQGLTHADIARRLGISKHTVSYHARTLGRPADPRFTRRYDWAAIQRFYDAGHSVTECQREFGFARETWNAARRRGAIVPRPRATPIEQLLVIRQDAGGRWNLRRRLLADGLKAPRCERCGIEDWLGEPLTLALHHINGHNRDNRLENLQLLCPNCHSQTENFGGRNAGTVRRLAS
jgi:5-methylcytosine-specific restriction endonuclease McrA